MIKASALDFICDLENQIPIFDRLTYMSLTYHEPLVDTSQK